MRPWLPPAAAGLDEIAALLEGHGVDGPFMQGAVNMEAMSFDRLFDDDPHTIFPYSPVIGARNPLSPPMRMRVSDDGEVHAEVTLEPQYAGPPGPALRRSPGGERAIAQLAHPLR